MDMPIGVIDSGVGGASILQALTIVMPQETYVFFADTFHAPYGNKSNKEVREIVLSGVKFLVEKRNIKMLVVACNTASAAAKNAILAKYPYLPCVFVEPPIKTAISDGKKDILVLATKRTLQDNQLIAYYSKISKKLHIKIKKIFISDLATAIDENDREKIKTLLQSKIKHNYDAIVLGCTHYNFIKQELQFLYPESEIFSCEFAVARRAESLLYERKMLLLHNQKRSIEIVLNSNNNGVRDRLRKLFPNQISTQKEE